MARITADHRRGDGGFSLVELVVAISLLGLGVVAILGAYATLILSGDRARKFGDISTVVAAASAAVVDPGRNPYVPCATPASYDPVAGVTLPNGLTADRVTVTSVQYWDGSTFQPKCYDVTVGSYVRLQEITLAIESVDGRVRQSVTVLKRGS
jgi:prepilin-type N-terminal cleavage/methylation domain-containing protein